MPTSGQARIVSRIAPPVASEAATPAHVATGLQNLSVTPKNKTLSAPNSGFS
jgi:hypothetical protein